MFPTFAYQLFKVLELTRHLRYLADARTFVGKRGYGYRPAAALFTQTVLDWDFGIGEENLGEVSIASHVFNGSNFNPWGFHWDQQAGNAVVFNLSIEVCTG